MSIGAAKRHCDKGVVGAKRCMADTLEETHGYAWNDETYPKGISGFSGESFLLPAHVYFYDKTTENGD